MNDERKIPAWEWLALVALLAAGFVPRTRDIGAFRLSPDDGNYLVSARAVELERGFDLARWVREDVAWIGELAEKSEADGIYPHSYLHQWVARVLYRSGASSVAALRLNSAVWGTLTSLAIFLAAAWMCPRRRLIALLAAALLAVHPMHVWYSRTGWGVIGCTFFLVVYAALCWELVSRTRDDERAKQVKLSVAMTAATILAWGYHEIIAVFVVSTGLCFLLAPWIVRGEEQPSLASALRSPKTWTFVASALPVGVFTVLLYFFSDFARAHWFDPDPMPYWKVRSESVDFLLFKQRLDLLLTWPILAAAAAGVVAMWREARELFLFLTVQVVGATALLFFLYQDPFLVRIYLPLAMWIVWLAAEGLVSAYHRFTARGLKRFAVALPAGLLVHLAAVSWITEFGALDHQLFLRHLYVADPGDLREPRHVDLHLTEHLRQHMKPGDRVWTYADKSPIFRLLDAGIASREFWFEGERTDWPEWLLAPTSVMKRDGRTVESGGAYAFVDEDRAGRIGLFRREP